MMRGRTVVAVVLTAACLTFLLIFPIFGVRLHRDGAVAVLSLHLTPVLFAISAVIALYFLRAPARACWAARPAIPITVPAHLIRPLWAIVLLAAAAFPFVASRSATDVMTLAWIYVLLGLGLNIAVGFAGLLVLGYAAFYAVGAYTYALLAQHWGLSFWWGLPIATLSAAAVGFLLGLPVLRLRGDYLAIVTLGFGEVIRLLLNNMNSLTGGPDGIGNIPRPTLLGLELTRKASAGGTTFHEWFGLPYRGEYAVIFLYLLGLALVLLILWVIRRLLYMPIGRAWEALREDETACRSLGLNPTAIKLSALTLSAACAGIAGAFFAARQGHINPESFTFLESAMVLAIVVLGGMGSQRGVVMAALLITILPEMARGFEAYRMLAFGLVMVLMMIVRPQGLWPAERPR